ncbi:hypothetical protein ACEWY4_017876 [Coilia grayii]|uniref:C2H2-type domain-containing protein n=1 Tax=Coilia grayii TaxID=363190 RepID=A0ABD1JID8_9TELE
MMKDSPSQAVENQGEPTAEEETMDLSWKEDALKVKEEEEREEEEEPSRQTDPEDDEGERPESGGPVKAESLVKKEVEEDDGVDKMVEEPVEDGVEDTVEKEEDSVVEEYGEEDMFVDAQDSPINYAKYDSPTPADAGDGGGGGDAGGDAGGWNGSPRAGQPSRLTCDICGLACVSLNVLLVHKRSHTGERPFHCQQCGASFTQKGNLLRHVKLHTGEKPFKCPMCSYACRRRDALSGHLRTHSVEKPYKCNHCGRSYKQRSSLEEHRERCHVYMQSRSHPDRGCEEVSSNGGRAQGAVERAMLLDRLASNVAKRKSTMPQKFVGEAPACLDLCFKREPGLSQSGSSDLRPQGSPTPEGLQGNPPNADQPPHRSFPTASSTPLSLTNGDRSAPGLHHLPPAPAPPPPGHLSLDHSHHQQQQPHPDRARRARHTSDAHRGALLHHQHPEQQHPFSLAHLLVPGPANGLPFPLHHHQHPSHPHGMVGPHPPAHPQALPPQELLRVVQGKGGEAVGTYMCGHCRVLFLDYVMFTIHMGCHGFRDPLECNVCGHLSRDRYEFSSHIARGEHFLEIK